MPQKPSPPYGSGFCRYRHRYVMLVGERMLDMSFNMQSL
ncbi:hypothetical protein EPYR_03536 [Erwinia pyrifoliae DSM 12163]|nr:hypothetical protein EPYR_03536 [Erwinia pyrifoliae DSM 12163]